MGYLHGGHISLIRKCRETADICIVSVFVNPTQFTDSEDLVNYPRDINRDKDILKEEKVDILFHPKADKIYQPSFQTYVEVIELSKVLEGEFRPQHFKGVTTIVSILFNCIQPDFAFFGQKDAQQCAVIKQMIKDLKYPVNMVICPVIREEDGLAMSSRNVNLTRKEREDAIVLYQSLKKGEELILKKEKNVEKIINAMSEVVNKVDSARQDYIAIVDSDSFTPVKQLGKNKSYYLLIACYIGNIRLIDNLLVTVK
ncbi:MAG: pantoate--beta-alanine ligase [Ignavibacteriaceae bacterium]